MHNGSSIMSIEYFTVLKALRECQLSALRLKHSSVWCNSLCSCCFHCHLSRHSSESIRSSTVADAFELSTERRARERQEYERLASEKEALRTLMEEEQRREEEQREKGEIARLRQEQVSA